MTPSSRRSEFESLLVALTNSDQKKAILSAALARKGLTTLSEKYQKQVEAAWDKANKQALAHMNIVLANNPMKDKDALLKRPDVISALEHPYKQAAQISEGIVRAAWLSAEAEVLKKVKGEFKLIKEDWAGHETDTALLDSLVVDLHANAEAMRARVGEALKNPGSKGTEAAMRGVTSDARNRASYSTSTAVWGVATQVRDSAFAAAGLNKMWVATTLPNGQFDGAVCSHCKGLHGMVIGPGEQFPANAGAMKLKVYKGKLLGPPRHPSCRCQIVGTKLKKSKSNL